MNTTSFILSEITYNKVEDDYSIESDIPSDYTEVDEEKDDSELKNTTSIILISDKAQKAKKELQKGKPKKKAIITELITESGFDDITSEISSTFKEDYIKSFDYIEHLISIKQKWSKAYITKFTAASFSTSRAESIYAQLKKSYKSPQDLNFIFDFQDGSLV